jgi:hypothetical protein
MLRKTIVLAMAAGAVAALALPAQASRHCNSTKRDIWRNR